MNASAIADVVTTLATASAVTLVALVVRGPCPTR